MKLEWRYCEFEKLFSFVLGGDWGKDVSASDPDFVEVYCIRGSEIKEWRKEKGRTAALRKVSKSSLEKRKLKEGDILVEISGGGPDQPVGRTVLIDKDVLSFKPDTPKVCTNFFRLVRLVDDVDKRFVNYYLNHFYTSGQIVSYQGGSNNLRNLRFPEYSKINIPLPPLPEQKRIVAKLDTLFAHLDQLRSRLDKIPVLLKQFRQAVLTQAVTGKLTEEWRGRNSGLGSKHLVAQIKQLREQIIEKDRRWSRSKLTGSDLISILPDRIPDSWTIVFWRDVGLSQNGKTFSSGDYIDKGVKLLRPGNLHVSGIVLWNENNTKYLTKAYAEVASDYIVRGNEIVMNLTAQSLKDEFLGRVCLTGANEECLLNQRQARILPVGFDTKFCFWLFKSSLFRQFVDQLNSGTLIQHMYTSQLDEFRFALPPIEEQREIVCRVERLFGLADRLDASYRSLKGTLDQAPQGILSKAFRGELSTDKCAKELRPYDQRAEDLLIAAETKAGL